MNPNDNFTVLFRGVEFTLTRSQVEFDSPNFFTACFLGKFQESETRTVKISRDPVLFGIVFDYLCGYTVLPLGGSVIPTRMSLTTALINLRVDAEFYQLDGLLEMCNGTSTTSASENDAICVAIAGTTGSSFPIENSLIPLVHSFNEFSVAYISKEKALQDLPNLATPQSCKGAQGIQDLAVITKVVSQQFKSYDRTKWTILGWHTSRSPRKELVIVLENVE
ncbi:hypothetical protein BDV93DRAFT_546028 [Ceratobasidium sp. AG-I]|nr:hypothetical protein BDV93DRAFT_546028 [Ceratobasidium sp. AG-I]